MQRSSERLTQTTKYIALAPQAIKADKELDEHHLEVLVNLYNWYWVPSWRLVHGSTLDSGVVAFSLTILGIRFASTCHIRTMIFWLKLCPVAVTVLGVRCVGWIGRVDSVILEVDPFPNRSGVRREQLTTKKGNKKMDFLVAYLDSCYLFRVKKVQIRYQICCFYTYRPHNISRMVVFG